MLLRGGSGLRDPAIDALACIGSPAVEPLLALRSEEDGRYRKRAYWALARIDDPRLLDTFLSVLESDEDWEVRRKAALTLIRWHERRALEALIDGLGDENESVRRTCKRVLERKTGAKNVGDDPAAWRKWLARRDEAHRRR